MTKLTHVLLPMDGIDEVSLQHQHHFESFPSFAKNFEVNDRQLAFDAHHSPGFAMHAVHCRRLPCIWCLTDLWLSRSFSFSSRSCLGKLWRLWWWWRKRWIRYIRWQKQKSERGESTNPSSKNCYQLVYTVRFVCTNCSDLSFVPVWLFWLALLSQWSCSHSAMQWKHTNVDGNHWL